MPCPPVALGQRYRRGRPQGPRRIGLGHERIFLPPAANAVDPFPLGFDLVEGDPTLFVRRDEAEAQWEWIDGIRAGWQSNAIVPRSYAAGTWGPSAAIALTERDGVTWHE